MGSRQSSPASTYVRGRRNSLASSTAIIGASTRSELPVVASSTTCSSVRRSAPISATRMPSPTSCALSAAGVDVPHDQPVAVAVHSTPPSSSATTRSGVGRADQRPGRSAPAAWPARPARPAGRGPSRRPGCTAPPPRPAGGWTGRPWCRPAFSSTSRSRISRMPRGSRPLVGSSRISSRGLRSSAAASPSRCRMPSEYALTGRWSMPASPTRSSASPTRCLRVRRGASGPAASKQRQVGPAGQVRVRAGALDQRADMRQHVARPASAPADPAPRSAAGGEDQAEQHPDERGLAASRSGRAGRTGRPSRTSRSTPSTASVPAVPLGQVVGGITGGLRQFGAGARGARRVRRGRPPDRSGGRSGCGPRARDSRAVERSAAGRRHPGSRRWSRTRRPAS